MQYLSPVPACCLAIILLLGSIPLVKAQGPIVVIAAVSPARNAVAVPRTAPVVIPFSQAIDPATTGGIKIFSSQYRGVRTATVSTNGNTATLVPTAPAGKSAGFRPGETVMVTVPAAVQGTSGGSVAPYVYQFTAAAGWGAADFTTGSTSVVGRNPMSVALGDLDGDSDLDFVTSNYNSNSVSVRFNNGQGSFFGTTDIPLYVTGGAVLGDVDSDGDLDLFAIGYPDMIYVCLNDGTGSFSGSQNVAVNFYPRSLVLGDVDGDGDLDMAVASAESGTVSVRLNDGAGTFSGSQNVPMGRQAFGPRAMTLGDVDNDGDLDMLTVHGSNDQTIRVRFNNGMGIFSGGSDIPVNGYGYPYNLVLGDMDSDGDLDMLVAGDVLTVLLNNGMGSFAGARNFSTTVAETMALGDLDGDGDLDYVPDNGAFQLNDGHGNFSGPTVVNTRGYSRGVALGDVDNDEALDIVITYGGPNCSQCPPVGNTVSVRLNRAALASASAKKVEPIFLFPNPAGRFNSVQVTWAVPADTRAVRVDIFNTLGQKVATAVITGQVGQVAGSLPTAGLAAGLYTVRLQAGAAVVTKRLELL